MIAGIHYDLADRVARARSAVDPARADPRSTIVDPYVHALAELATLSARLLVHVDNQRAGRVDEHAIYRAERDLRAALGHSGALGSMRVQIEDEAETREMARTRRVSGWARIAAAWRRLLRLS